MLTQPLVVVPLLLSLLAVGLNFPFLKPSLHFVIFFASSYCITHVPLLVSICSDTASLRWFPRTIWTVPCKLLPPRPAIMLYWRPSTKLGEHHHVSSTYMYMYARRSVTLLHVVPLMTSYSGWGWAKMDDHSQQCHWMLTWLGVGCHYIRRSLIKLAFALRGEEVKSSRLGFIGGSV